MWRVGDRTGVGGCFRVNRGDAFLVCVSVARGSGGRRKDMN